MMRSESGPRDSSEVIFEAHSGFYTFGCGLPDDEVAYLAAETSIGGLISHLCDDSPTFCARSIHPALSSCRTMLMINHATTPLSLPFVYACRLSRAADMLLPWMYQCVPLERRGGAGARDGWRVRRHRRRYDVLLLESRGVGLHVGLLNAIRCAVR